MKHAILRRAVSAALCIAATGAQAALTPMDSGSGSSLVFMAYDNAGSKKSITVDLSYFITDVLSYDNAATDFTVSASTLWTAPGTTIQWDLAHDSLRVNGADIGGTRNWSNPFGFFNAAASSTSTYWAVIAGDTIAGGSGVYLGTGNPTPTQLATMRDVDLSQIANLSGVNPLFNGNNGASNGNAAVRNSLGSAGAGANATVGDGTTATGYVLSNNYMGVNGNWLGTSPWSAFVAEGTASPLWVMNANPVLDNLGNAVSYTVQSLGGTFTYSAGVLTWTTAPVPEANGYLVALVGFAILLFAGRQRLGR